MKIKINKYTFSIEKEVKQSITPPVFKIDSILPIEINPNDNQEFLSNLLKTKSATITTFFNDGKQISKIWNAERMTARSNVIRNLRSRIEFRNGNWQKANIVKVLVEVNSNSLSQPFFEKNKTVNISKANIMKKDSKFHVLKNFETYLIEKNYSVQTSSGKPSTVYDYRKRVGNICEKEVISILKLAENIDYYVKKYDTDGVEAEYGNKSHRANINALKRFQDFSK